MKHKIFHSMIVIALILSLFSPDSSAKDKQTPAPDLGTMTGQEAETFYLGLNAVVWGYPSVLFEDLMRGRSLPDALKTTGNPQSLVNQLGFVRLLRGPEYKQIATPNNDTLYAQAFCDVSQEPLILYVPKVDERRYYTFQLWDPNGETFGYVGTRATGRESGHYALVGPDWKGTLPERIKRIDCPYNSFAIWGRIGVNGAGDIKNAHRIQDKLRLTPLSQFGKSDKQVPPNISFSQKRVAMSFPDDLSEDLIFYAKLARSLKYTFPKPSDIVIAESLSQIGFKNKNTIFDHNSLNDAQKKGLAKAVQFALHLMDINAETTGNSVNGWRWNPKSGIMGSDYLWRAAFAKWYTGGNSPQEAIYMMSRRDDEGNLFAGDKKYRLRFEKGEFPHVKAFWSVSMYHSSDGSFVANPIKRYSIGGRTPEMKFNNDGSLDIYFQHEAPSDPVQKSNWLPTPKKGFYLILRLYVPDDSLQKGTWAPPPVKIIND